MATMGGGLCTLRDTRFHRRGDCLWGSLPYAATPNEKTLRELPMKYLHTMVRVTDLDKSLHFYRDLLGLQETRRIENEKGRFTLVFLAPPGQEDAPVELTYNWDPEVYTGGRNFGHLAYEVDDIYAFCDKLQKAGVTINRPPRDGHMAFVRSPDNISVEILQKGGSLPPQEPWASMPNTGVW
jgi:lactoylglutathione lyase